MMGILGPYSPFLVGGQNCFRGEGPFGTLQGGGPPPLAPPMPMYDHLLVHSAFVGKNDLNPGMFLFSNFKTDFSIADCNK